MMRRTHLQEKPLSSSSQGHTKRSQFAPRPFAPPVEVRESPSAESLERAARFGHSFGDVDIFPKETVQPKLVLGPVGDKYEQEADRVARRVVETISSSDQGAVQRQENLEDEDELEEEEPIQGKFASEPTGTTQANEETPPNRTGMPDHLKSGIEGLSGLDLSGVRVHYSSPKPARLNALAYTQGQEIHVAPGQERHLHHEGWHAVQQMQGRVKSTMQTRGVSINDDAALEREADVMGAKALQITPSDQVATNSFTVAQGLRVSGAAVQRDVDTSSSPFLPEYEEDEIPAWKYEQGVPEWAKEQYRKEAKLTLIASVSNGKIGSVYFPEGRIRTTHSAGPEEEGHLGDVTLQFNIDIIAAEEEFKSENSEIEENIEKQIDKSLSSEEQEEKFSELYYEACDRWIANRLNNSAVSSTPDWATPVTDPETAMDLETEKPSENTVLFEVFTSVSGEVQGWHPSRGVAAKFVTNKQVVAVLKAALAKLEKDKITDPGARNVAFYNFIKSRLPDFASEIREPNEI